MQVSLSRTVGLICLLVVLAGCTTSKHTPATQEERLAAWDRLESCIKKHMEGASEPKEVLKKAYEALRTDVCAKEQAEHREVYTRGIRPSELNSFLNSEELAKQLEDDRILLQKRQQ